MAKQWNDCPDDILNEALVVRTKAATAAVRTEAAKAMRAEFLARIFCIRPLVYNKL